MKGKLALKFKGWDSVHLLIWKLANKQYAAQKLVKNVVPRRQAH